MKHDELQKSDSEILVVVVGIFATIQLTKTLITDMLTTIVSAQRLEVPEHTFII